MYMNVHKVGHHFLSEAVVMLYVHECGCGEILHHLLVMNCFLVLCIYTHMCMGLGILKYLILT